MNKLIAISLLTLPLLVARADDWRLEEKETLHKTFKVAAGENVSKLIVDHSNGYVHVTGGSGTEIQVTVEKEIRAESQDAMDRAKKDVKYEMTQEGNSVKLHEDRPSHRDDRSREDRYNVRFDVEVQVPVGASLDLRTMNGRIEVKNSTADFNLHTMNGHVDMQDIGGTGSVETMNGPVKVAFSRNPSKDCSFHTMNGPVDVYFNSNPNANLTLETMHGAVYSDFDVTTMPTVLKGGSTNRFVYRSGGTMKVRAGSGGPELKLHTMNGTIRLHSKGI